MVTPLLYHRTKTLTLPQWAVWTNTAWWAWGMSPEPPMRGDKPFSCPQAAVLLVQKPFYLGSTEWAIGQPRHPGAGSQGVLGGPGEGGPGPFKGGGCHSESPFLCWRAGRAPRGGNPGRGTAWQGRAPHAAPRQQSGRSGHLTKSSTMGEYEGWGPSLELFLVLYPTWEPYPRAEPTKLSSGTSEVLVTPVCPWEDALAW